MSTKHWWLCIVVAANVCKISVRLAASRPLFSAVRPPVNYIFIWVAAGRVHKLSLIFFLQAAGGHLGSNCMRSAAKQQKNGGRLAAAVACYLLVTGCRISIFKE
jgi:hypothetical protein